MNHTIHTSRRTLLKSAGIAAVAAASLPLTAITSSTALAADAPTTDPWRGLKMGMASYTFSGLPLDACIRDIQRLDLHYVSIKDAHLKLDTSTEERKAVAQKFRDAGITPLSCGVIYFKNDEKQIRQIFEYARDIGVPTIVGGPDPDALDLCDKFVKEFDIKVAIHNHGPTDKHYHTPADAWAAIEKHDPRIGLCMDVGHTARAGADPAADMIKFKDRLYDVHMKDVTLATDKGKPTECGRGVLDIPAMMRSLLQIKYAHHVGLEYEKNMKDPLPGASESIGYMKGVLRVL
jgi:sugar phosphate isomerase/epimerase